MPASSTSMKETKRALSGLSISHAATTQRGLLRSFLIAAHIGSLGTVRIEELVVATLGNELVGCAGVEIAGDCAILHSVAVRKAWRGRGIGMQLVRRCLSQARKQRVTYFALTTMFWNVDFFRQCGFETISRKELPTELRSHRFFSLPRYRYTTPMAMPSSRHVRVQNGHKSRL